MAKQKLKWETEIGPEAIHNTLDEAVAAELSHLLGHRGGTESQVPALASTMVCAPDIFIQCLNQLTNRKEFKNVD